LWGHHEVDSDFIVSTAYGQGMLYALGINGLVKYVGNRGRSFSAASVKGKIRQFEIKNAANRGKLSRIKLNGNEFMACGWGGQVYHIDGNQVSTFENGITKKKTHILDIAGEFPSDLYAVGMGGVLLHFDGVKWTYLDSPTNNHLYSVLYVSSDQIYICGAQGGLYLGDRNGWTFIGEETRSDNFWSMALFDDSLFISFGDKGLLRQDRNRTFEVDFNLGYSPYTHRLSNGGGALWSTGSQDLLKFDGATWEVVTCPDNE
jgi:hypothetical protein